MARIVFVDVETTGLDVDRHHAWEIALIVREPDKDDVEYTWQVVAPMATADPTALRINRYYERFVWGSAKGPRDLAVFVAKTLDGAHLAAANPAFDAAFLGKFLRDNGQCPAWHYRLICVESMAMTALGSPVPLGLGKCAERLGLDVDESVAHTALGDAALARDVYDNALRRTS